MQRMELMSWPITFHCLFQADLYSILSARSGKAGNKPLYFIITVGRKRSIESEEHFHDKNFVYLCLCSETCKTEKITVISSANKDAILL